LRHEKRDERAREDKCRQRSRNRPSVPGSLTLLWGLPCFRTAADRGHALTMLRAQLLEPEKCAAGIAVDERELRHPAQRFIVTCVEQICDLLPTAVRVRVVELQKIYSSFQPFVESGFPCPRRGQERRVIAKGVRYR
jgi:hypothetical protein